MKRPVLVFALSWFLLGALPAGATTTTELLDDPESWDGRSVVVIGELVGDYGKRSNGTWVQLNDDPYSERPLRETGVLLGMNAGMSVLIPSDLVDAEAWGPAGRYRTRGPVVSITAVFRYNSPLRQGATFLEAKQVTLIEPARAMIDTGPTWPTAVGLVLLGSAVALWLSIRYVRRRRLSA